MRFLHFLLNSLAVSEAPMAQAKAYEVEMVTAERKLDQDTNLDLNQIQENGQEIDAIWEPGHTKLVNMGNSGYMEIIVTSSFISWYFLNQNLKKAFEISPADLIINLNMQLTKFAHGGSKLLEFVELEMSLSIIVRHAITGSSDDGRVQEGRNTMSCQMETAMIFSLARSHSWNLSHTMNSKHELVVFSVVRCLGIHMGPSAAVVV
ncbi:hypothetical protein VNO77_03928 [Canavalia gladiata]|uniref:Uncharacterized protein n=1 Tax=Canavalia gladiata TaxID=3824 RepID=A0AAN9N0R2_CANGL